MPAQWEYQVGPCLGIESKFEPPYRIWLPHSRATC
jgi:hypothetical protein